MSDNSCLILFILAAKIFFYSTGMEPNFLNSKLITPFLPKISEFIECSSFKFLDLFSLSLNSVIFFSNCDIFIDYFLTQEKQ